MRCREICRPDRLPVTVLLAGGGILEVCAGSRCPLQVLGYRSLQASILVANQPMCQRMSREPHQHREDYR